MGTGGSAKHDPGEAKIRMRTDQRACPELTEGAKHYREELINLGTEATLRQACPEFIEGLRVSGMKCRDGDRPEHVLCAIGGRLKSEWGQTGVRSTIRGRY